MKIHSKFFQYYLRRPIAALKFLLCLMGFTQLGYAATYNLSGGTRPPCSTNWSVSGTTYTCAGNGTVTLAAGDIVTASSNSTIVAANGFSLGSNTTIGTASITINLTSSYGTVASNGPTTLYGSINGGSGFVTLINTAVSGTITTSANISLTGGSVGGLVTSGNNSVTTNGTNLSAGARAQTGLSITGGTIAGAFVMTSYNPATFSGVTMTSGSISGASTVNIQNESLLGSSSSSITISSSSGAITVDNSTVYGNLTAPNYSTVNITNDGAVYGNCSPGSTPANSCGSIPSTPMNCANGVARGITGNYFNNRTLNGSATATRSDAPIDFLWGSAAPGPNGISADNFSVRWTGYVRITQSGAYRFQTVSDDGVRLYLNDTVVINRWNDHSSATDTTGDINLVAGQTYAIRLEYYENAGDAVIRLQWRLPGTASFVAIPGGPVPTLGAGLYECAPLANPPISSCATSLSAGVTGNYFNNQNLTAPVTATRIDGPINFDWSTGLPGPTGVDDDNFSVRWTGYIHANQTGVYRFQTNSDDGIRLTVNGVLLIDQWNDHSVTAHTSAAVNLEAGKSYPFTMEFYENGGYAVAQLRWQTPGSASYVAIPIGVTANPVSSPGLYECVTTPASYTLTHSAQGITCKGEAVMVTAFNSVGAIYNPPAGTTVTMSTSPATGTWVGGNTYVFSGAESSFTKYLQQTSPAILQIRAESPTASRTSTITFLNTILKISQSATVDLIPTQVAGVNGNAMLSVLSTNPKTGVCEARVPAGTKGVELAYSCNNPVSCVSGQTFSVNGIGVSANANNAASLTYANINVTFNSSAQAPLTINYSDVGQVTLHGRMTIDQLGNDPALTLLTSSNPFVVKPYTLAVLTAVQTATPFKVNPGTTHSGASFVPAGEKFSLNVQSRNAQNFVTPNFGNEILVSGQSVERNKIAIEMGCPERAGVLDPVCSNRRPVYPTTPEAGNLVIGEDNNNDLITDSFAALSGGAVVPVVWNEVGSLRLEPYLSGTGYLGQGNVSVITPSSNIGRFFPASFQFGSSLITNSCGSAFSYMEHPNIKVEYTFSARNKNNVVVKNYDNKTRNYVTAGIEHVLKDLSAVDVMSVNKSFRFGTTNTAQWDNGTLNFRHDNAIFYRARNTNGNIVVEPPYINNLRLGVKFLTGDDPVNVTTDMNAEIVNNCSGNCNATSLGIFNAMRFGRLRLDSGFGSGAADLPVNFITEFWTGNNWIRNTDDSCTGILRSNIFYGTPGIAITSAANLNVSLTGGSTTGVYSAMDTTTIGFSMGSAAHRFSAPGGNATGTFAVRIDLMATPWLMFDWNQSNATPTLDKCPADSDCNVRATFGFGDYRGHDRIIYWRERF